MKSIRIAAALLTLSVLGTTALAQEAIAKSKVDAVTVYRGQALVTRNVELPAGAGLGELVISELPDGIIAASIFAEGSDGVEVRSVRYRERAVPTDVREEVRKIDEAIIAAGDKIAANQKQMQVLQEQRTYLDKLENFAAPTATTEMTKGVLNADQLKTLTNFQFESRQKIATEELRLQQEARTLQEQASLLSRQKGETAGRSSKTVREAVVFTNRERAGGTLRLKYLVGNASWNPSYNVRADADKKNATIEYLAAISQMSGEDWSDVSMTLSTASPNLVAAAPTLAPLNIALAPISAPGGRGGAAGGGFGLSAATAPDLGIVAGNISMQRAQAENTRSLGNGINNFDMRVEEQRALQDRNDKLLNRVADQLQVLELITKDSKSDSRSPNSSEGIVVTYQMKSRTSLPSRADRQLIQIDQLQVKSTFYKIAVPVLTSYVYDQADLVNTSSSVLLAGPVASYAGGQFVGTGAIDTVAVGQPFTVGFGIDSALRATRERVEKTEQIQAGNRVVNFTYRLAIENFGSKPADVRLMDRLPVGKETEVRITFDDAEAVKLSADKEYLQTERKKGILRWDVTVPAQKAGSEAFALTYKLHLEHDKTLNIATSGVLTTELYQLLNN
ncbi:MAG TPA: mucoidy inhibitor MuiA family protein [Phycisphaerae bacterium]|jgi:hypothetical protein|nr:mucoidy inhibitor MuiA family protein [Phycisphaerae bacterium]